MKEKILKRKKELIGAALVVLAVIVVISVLVPKKAKVIDVFNELKSQSEVSSRIKSHTVSEKEDDDGIPIVHFQDESFEDKDAMILMCGSEDEAEVFQYYFEEISNQEKAIRDKAEYGNYFRDVAKINGWISYVYKVDNCVLYLPIIVGDEVAAKYKKAFEASVKNLNFNKEDYDTDVATAKANIKSNIDESVAEYKKAIDDELSRFKTSGDDELKTLKTSQDESSLNQFKEKYLSTDASIFKDKVEAWKKEVKNIESQIAAKKKKAEEEKKKAEERAKNTHGAGTYKVGTDIAAGEYYISGSGYFSISKNGSGDLSSIIVNDNFKNNSIVTVTNGQYLNVQRATFMPIKYAPEPDLTQEGMFKVGTYLPAGEYKLKATSSSYSGYYAVYSSSKHALSNIVKNKNFDGTTYVTVKKGQYLLLNRCTIVK